jgi:uncharacterized SAM-binding protein YcdF (DUF218 family)
MRRVVPVSLRVAGLLIAGALILFAVLVWRVDALGRQDLARPADAIVVFGARVDPDGRPGSDLTSRTYHAVDLWNAGIAPHIICTGGFEGARLSAAAVCGRFAAQLGVPSNRIWLADGATNTAEDAKATAQILTDNRWRSVVLVSHPLHLFRARWLFQRNGVDAATSPTSTDTGRIFTPLRLWYAVREAGAVVLMSLDDLGLVSPDVVSRLQDWSSNLP